MVLTLTHCGNPPNLCSFNRFASVRLAYTVPSTWTPTRNPKARSITYDIYHLSFTTALSEVITKDHLATTGLLGAKGNTCLRYLSCMLTRVSCLSRPFMILVFSYWFPIIWLTCFKLPLRRGLVL